MRILLLSYEFPPETGFGGIGTYTWYQARALVKLGHEVHVLAGVTEPSFLTRQEVDGVLVWRFGYAGIGKYVFGVLKKANCWWTRNRLYNAYSMYQGVRKLIQYYDFDVIEMPECGAEGLFVNRIKGLNTVVRFHSPARLITEWYELTLHDKKACERLELESIHAAGSLTSCSQFLAGATSQTLGLNRPVEVIYNGIDLDLFGQSTNLDIRDRIGAKKDDVVVLFTGRMEARKGMKVLREVLLEIGERDNLIVLLVGDDLFGELAAMQKDLYDISKRMVRAKILALGRLSQPQVRACLQACDIFLIPSMWESCPYSCLEAMASGKAIVASDAGGLPEMLEDGESGRIIEKENGEGFIDALSSYIDNKTLRQEHGAASKKTAQQRFADTVIAEETIKFYQNSAS